MKYVIFLYHFLFSVALCMAMDQEKKIVIGPDLTYINWPSSVKHLGNNDLIISDSSRFSIVNPREKKNYYISGGDIFSMRLGPVMRMENDKILSIRNTKIGIRELASDKSTYFEGPDELQSLSKYVYDPVNGHIFFPDTTDRSLLRCYDYIANTCGTIQCPNNIWMIALHPTKKSLCLGGSRGTFFLYNLRDLKTIQATIKLPIEEFLESGPCFCDYTRDGDHIIVVTNDIFKIDLTDKHNITCSLLAQPKYNFRRFPIALHPDGFLATTDAYITDKDSSLEYLIDYWDLKSGKKVHTMPKIQGTGLRHISFFPNGTDQCLVWDNGIIEIAPVPSQVNIKQIQYYKLWILDQFKENYHISQQLKNYIATILLAALKH